MDEINQSDWLKLFGSAGYTNSTHFRANRGAVTRRPSEAISGAATGRPSGVDSGVLTRRELKALTVLTSVVSSAYSIALNLSLAVCKSFIYSMNNNGPNIDP